MKDMTAYTIETWLKGMVDFDVPSATIMAILFNNGVDNGAPMQDVSEQQRDLCLADLLMWLSSSSTASSGEMISDNGWSHQKSAKQVVDRDGYIRRAHALYVKWNSDKAKTAVGTKITLKPIY
jgi:hypothetical protein